MTQLDSYELPSGWEWVRLGNHVIKVGSGVTPRGGESVYQNAGIPLIRSQNVHMQSFSRDGLAYISSTEDESMAQSRVVKNDVLLNITGGSIGRVCLVPDEVCPANVNQHVSIIRCADSINPRYLVAYLASNHVQRYIMGAQAGATRQALTKSMIEDFMLPLPPLAEQKRIVTILTQKLAAIAKARAAAQTQLAAAQALPAAYLRQIFESEEAQGWPRYQLIDVCSITAAQVDPTLPEFRNLPHINGENIESGTGRLLKVKTAEEDGMTSGKYFFESDDVLYSKLRPYLRKVTLARYSGVCSADMYPIKVNRNLLRPEFMVLMLLSKEFTDYADEESQRSRMPKLNRQQLFNWTGPVPPLNTQDHIISKMARRSESVERLSKSIEQRMEIINQLPGALLRQAFNGEL